MAIRKDLIALLLVLFLSFFAIKPLFSQGYFTMHDNQHVARLFEFDKSLKAGQFPVRWVEGLGFGYGYNLFNFYPPLTYYVGESVHLVTGAGFVDSVKIVWALAILGSGVSMYFLGRQLFGRSGGVLAALFYVYAPYHAVDAYVRGALAELSSFVWLPLILLFAYKTAKDPKLINALWTGFFLGLLMLTHNLILLPFFGVFAAWSAIQVLIHKQNLLKVGSYFLLATVIAFGLSAFFWLPSLWEKQFTLVDSLLIKNLASYKIHFVCASQLWDSAWGFGGSTQGCIDGVSFKIGKIYILTSILSLFVMLKLWLVGKRQISLTIASSFVLLVGCIFMTTEYSKFVWDNIKELWYLQFPWRFLEFIVLFSSILAGSLVLFVKNKYQKAGIVAIFVALLLFYNIKLFTPQTFLPDATDKILTSNEEIKWNISGTSFEYMPQGVATKITDLGTVWVDIEKSEIKDKNLKAEGFNILRENFYPDRFQVTVRGPQDGQIEFQTTNFPGWKIWIDGKEVEIQDDNKFNLMTVNVPKGEHVITGRFEDTPVRTLGNLISLVSVALLVVLYIYGNRRNSQ